MTAGISSLMPSWVEPEPFRSRSRDPLGLQVTADRIAENLLPGISGGTFRARYYSLLAWARRACGKEVDERHIHRLEVALAVREMELHVRSKDKAISVEPCRFVGKQKLGYFLEQSPKLVIPKDPSAAYSIPVWRTYRPSMQQLGLTTSRHELEDDGKKLAKAFSTACHPQPSGDVPLPESACLTQITTAEAEILRACLGVWRQGKVSDADESPPALRRRMQRTMDDLPGPFSVTRMLQAYEVKTGACGHTQQGLREAAVWERLSLGLQALFLLSLHQPKRVQSHLRKARAKKAGKPTQFRGIAVDMLTADAAVRSIRRAFERYDRLSPKGHLCRVDDSAFDLGRQVIGSASTEEVLKALRLRHEEAKGDDAWTLPGTAGALELPRQVPLHGYRLTAFHLLLSDLRRA